MSTRSLLFAATLVMACATPAAAQTRGGGAGAAAAATTPCFGGRLEGDLGFTGTECVRCIVQPQRRADAPWIEFQTEPTLTGITRGGPADGRLEERDVLVAIEGDLITTYAAAMRFSHLEPGKPVRLTIRRAGVVKDVVITPGSKCANANRWLIPPRVQLPKKPLQMTLARKMGPLATASSGWLGVGVRCVLCEVLRADDAFTFRSYLEIIDVQPNTPAMQAGLKAGDLLIAIDGLSLKSIEGTQRFRNVKPGERVTLSFVRDGEVKTVTLTVAARPSEIERAPLRSR